MSDMEKPEIEEIRIQGIPSPPDTASWFEYSWKLQQAVPERLEDVAKFLVAMISLSLTIITTSIAAKSIFLSYGLPFWLLAAFFAFLVLFPRKYRFHSQSVESVKKAHAEIVRRKQKRLLIATICYFIPFLVLLVIHFLNLLGVIS